MYGSPRLLGALQSIYGPDFVPFAESLALKQPDTGAAFQFHQDALGPVGPVSTGRGEERGLNVGIYLSPSTRSNGCLWAFPGSHTGGRLNVPAPASPPPPCRPR
jgi:ectoine hydroxylase-related dioxygenase (phytanoyl-CoA dioxygenase family)